MNSSSMVLNSVEIMVAAGLTGKCCLGIHVEVHGLCDASETCEHMLEECLSKLCVILKFEHCERAVSVLWWKPRLSAIRFKPAS